MESYSQECCPGPSGCRPLGSPRETSLTKDAFLQLSLIRAVMHSHYYTGEGEVFTMMTSVELYQY